MSPSSPTNRKLSNPSPTRNQLVERCSSLRGCEPCKRRKRICNGQRPCTHCTEASQECVYSVVSDHPRSVFTTSTARRLSSGSACETCRRRKTKCDGASPCSFCASSGIECINNSERRKRSVIASTTSTLPITSSSLATNSSTIDNTNDNEAIDRIEDRLRRIEKLMTAFTPSPLSQQTQSFSKEIKDIKRVTAGFRKLSSPHLQKPSGAIQQQQRQHRHSTTSLDMGKRTNDAIINKDTPYASPPNSNGSLKSFTSSAAQQVSSTPSPPLSPRLLKRQNSATTNMVATSMLNLSLSPSSSSTSSSSSNIYHTFNNNSTSPLSTTNYSTPSSSSAASTPSEWKQSTPIPSLMDQLSKYTFATAAMDYTTVRHE